MTDILNDMTREGIPFAEETVTDDTKDRLRQMIRERDNADDAAGNVVAVEDIDAEDLFRKLQKAVLMQADETLLTDHAYVGDVCGVGCAETGKYYLLAKAEDNPANHPKLGRIVTAEEYRALMDNTFMTLDGCTIFGAYVEGEWVFHMMDEVRTGITTVTFGLVNQLFSRNTGLFESDSMMTKTAVIVGQGSAGSVVALYLARSGVGRFILVDADTMELHNICRHQLDSRDLGRYKVDAMRDAILRINPKAEVQVFRGWLEKAPMDLFSDVKDGIVVATADDMVPNALANELAKVMGVPFVAFAGWTRCHAGEIFYWMPGKGLPTYGQAFRDLIAEAEATPKADHSNYFADAHDAETLNFETGTGVDLGFISMAALKFILDLLNLGNDHYTTRVLDDYTHYTLICNTNKPEIGGENAAMFPKPMYISDNITLSAEGDCA